MKKGKGKKRKRRKRKNDRLPHKNYPSISPSTAAPNKKRKGEKKRTKEMHQ